MKQKTAFIIIVIGLIIITLLFLLMQFRNKSSNPQIEPIALKNAAKPSETYIDYADPAGFGFSYPDDLSISKAEIEDSAVYTDLQIYSKDVSGSVKIKITDTKIASLSGWLKDNGIPESNTPKEKKLGNLNALEVRTNDRLMLGALDQGVLFTVELPLIEENFWMSVYDKVITGFSFVSPQTSTSASSDFSDSDVIFEGEEVIE